MMYDVVVAGAGAAGLTAAIFAAEKGATVCILERTDKPGKKILMSGGTRCNVLPVRMNLDDYYTDSSTNLLKRIFRSWSVDACKSWFEADLKLHLACEIESNKWFPVSNSAKDVRDALLNKALSLGVIIRYNQSISGLQQSESEDSGWEIAVDGAREPIKAQNVIIATGGLSVPTTGTDGGGHKLLKSLGVALKPTYPALTPLTGSHPGAENLAGISLTVSLSQDKQTAKREGFLFTHKGFSGPSVLDISHLATRFVTGLGPKPEYRVNWTGEAEDVWKKRLSDGKGTVKSVLKEHLPNRLADALLVNKPYSDHKIAELSKSNRLELLKLVSEYTLDWSSHEGYKKAEVTGGGVPLEAINTATMELKDMPGLFVCGEIVEVFGRIGGFNFYWAWVSGRLAGKSVKT